MLKNRVIYPLFSTFFQPLHILSCFVSILLSHLKIENAWMFFYQTFQSPNLMNLSRVSNSQKNPVSIERLLKSWNIGYNFKWNQTYLSRRLNLSRGSNTLNLVSGFTELSGCLDSSLVQVTGIWYTGTCSHSCCRPHLEADDRPLSFCFSICGLGTSFKNLFWNIMGGFWG